MSDGIGWREGGRTVMISRSGRVAGCGHRPYRLQGHLADAWLTGWAPGSPALALAPATEPSLFAATGLPPGSTSGGRCRRSSCWRGRRDAQPEVVFHLAGQPLLRRPRRPGRAPSGPTSWARRCWTRAGGLGAAVVVVTSDKCYLGPDRPAPRTIRSAGSSPTAPARPARRSSSRPTALLLPAGAWRRAWPRRARAT